MQTAGRTARHVNGRVILYADHKTDAIRELLRITKAHREKQIAYNERYGIVPKSVKRKVNESSYVFRAGERGGKAPALPAFDLSADGKSSKRDLLEELTRDMLEAADRLEFERAAYLRDRLKELKSSRG